MQLDGYSVAVPYRAISTRTTFKHISRNGSTPSATQRADPCGGVLPAGKNPSGLAADLAYVAPVAPPAFVVAAQTRFKSGVRQEWWAGTSGGRPGVVHELKLGHRHSIGTPNV